MPSNTFSYPSEVAVNNYTHRMETHNGEKHVVVPVIMMVEGVHSGSGGPLFHPAEELGRRPETWNGIPVVVHHPEDRGEFVSANSPDIEDREKVGTIFNTEFTDGKLRAEAWINVRRLEEVNEEALDYIMNHRPLDVSLGLFSDDEMVEGDWNGELYTGISRNHVGDHLALLPGERGACSWGDGCGVRANKGKEEKVDKLKYVVVNTGFRSIMSAIQMELDRRDTQQRIYFLTEVFEDNFIYKVAEFNGEGVPIQETFFRVDYSYDEEQETVEIGTNEVEVKKKTEFIEVKTNKVKRIRTKNNEEGGVTTMSEACTCKVDTLISANKGFTEEHREWLSTLEEAQLDAILANSEPVETVLETQDPVANEGNEVIEEEVVATDSVEALKEEIRKDPNTFMNLLPAEQREQLQHGAKLFKERRSSLITKISANTDVYTVEELSGMKTEALEKLASAIKIPVSYVGNITGHDVPSVNGEGEEAALLPPGVTAQ
jgi:hypothetical protein